MLVLVAQRYESRHSKRGCRTTLRPRQESIAAPIAGSRSSRRGSGRGRGRARDSAGRTARRPPRTAAGARAGGGGCSGRPRRPPSGPRHAASGRPARTRGWRRGRAARTRRAGWSQSYVPLRSRRRTRSVSSSMRRSSTTPAAQAGGIRDPGDLAGTGQRRDQE